MAKTDITGRAGEHHVAAELSERGVYASPFSGNVPEIDVIAADAKRGEVAFIQVKTKRLKSHRWRLSISVGWCIPKEVKCLCLDSCDSSRCAGVLVRSRNHPHHERATNLNDLREQCGRPRCFWVFVSLEERGFWVIPDGALRRAVRNHHTSYLKERGGHRPGRKHDSLVTYLSPEDLAQWHGCWNVLGLGLQDSG